MELSAEDSLRLNVLLANRPLAIRIDEERMIVHGLGPKGEMVIRLNPNTRPDRYLRLVRESISGHVLGSPGGYPVYLRRWTRMGQMRAESLAQLLLLGEPEAVVAAVCSPGLDDELARRAWWAMEDAENARRMLANPAIVAGPMGRVLADYLVDYLPFETEADRMMETVRLVLQTGLADAAVRDDLWRKSARKHAYLVGFLQARPDDLPDRESPRTLAPDLAKGLRSLGEGGNGVAELVLRVHSAAGQTWLRAVASLLERPSGQDLVVAAFDCLRDYFAPLRPNGDPDLPMGELIADAAQYVAQGRADPAVAACLRLSSALDEDLAAMRVLSGLGYGAIRPVLPDPTALGTPMRRKLAPIVEPIQVRIGTLRGVRR